MGNATRLSDMSGARAETVPVCGAHAFDVERLETYLEREAPELRGRYVVRQFGGGQSNPTYLLTSAGGRCVLRRKPPGLLLPSAHAVNREFRVMRALQGAGVPVPKAYLYCADESVIGTPFFIMEYVEGRIFWDRTLPALSTAQRAATYDEMNRVLAALHSVDPASVGLHDFGGGGSYVARQIARWTKQYRASQTETIEAMERLIEWLPQHTPPDEPPAIIHGDYRLGNVIFDPRHPRILAVIDWELSTIGSPLADLAYHCMIWRVPRELPSWLGGGPASAPGIPTEEDHVRAYCRRTGRRSIPNLDFYMAFNMFRLAGILQGIAARVQAGNASNAHAMETGQLARPVAEAGWAQALRCTPPR